MNEKNGLNKAEYFFHQGTNFYSYDYLGVTEAINGNEYVYTFRVWAPNAERVELVSDFSGWNSPMDMLKVTKGIWEIAYHSPKCLIGCLYKFKITKNGSFRMKGDPYARYSKGGADGASIIFRSDFKWTDAFWLQKRKINRIVKNSYLSIPINIYELHLGSFLKQDNNSYLSYREIADALIPYIRYMGYTHVELMPVSEYPYDASWGYQVGAFFAPTSRFGNPDDFRYMINKLHNAGIGVIIDWVPAHFPKDEWGLFEFDGGPLYEYQGIDRQESLSWGTRFFDVGREEVQSFLISNALYFFREFHIDGLRVDAVASMLYLDYDKPPHLVVKNINGGRENLEAIAFFKKLNTVVFAEFPEALMIAEESGDFGRITLPVHEGGLGFNLKWNMGWSNDFFDYLQCDPLFRSQKHSALTFPIMYAFSENYVLPISHDEVVHGKKSFIDKIFGSYEDKLKEIRAAMMYMMTFPGKKLTFMGTEFAQFREWDFKNSLEWFMLDYEKHRSFREYVAALNKFYLDRAELWAYDFSPDGFEWILPDENDKNIVVYKRKNKDSELTVIISFSGVEHNVRIKFNKKTSLKCIFSTELYNGEEKIVSVSENGSYYADITIPAFSGKIYSLDTVKLKIN